MERDKLKYVVLVNSSASKLTQTVNEYIENGWKAVGSHQVVTKHISVERQGTQHRYENQYSQTLIRD